MSIKTPYLLSILFLFVSNLNSACAQSIESILGKEYKCFNKNRIDFNQITFNLDYTIIKSNGQLIDGEEKFDERIVVEQNKIIINNDTILVFHKQIPKPTERIIIHKIDRDTVFTTIENLLIPFPENLKCKYVKHYKFIRFDSIPSDYGAVRKNCITELDLFSTVELDKTNNILNYKGTENLMPHILNCASNAEYSLGSYFDMQFTLIIPKNLHYLSFGFGDDKFYLRFDEIKDGGETTIQIDYDFKGEFRTFLEKQVDLGEAIEKSINNIPVIIRDNWQGMYCMYALYENNKIVSFYSAQSSYFKNLKKCITSLKYE